jgi:hypothetical protein
MICSRIASVAASTSVPSRVLDDRSSATAREQLRRQLERLPHELLAGLGGDRRRSAEVSLGHDRLLYPPNGYSRLVGT